MKQIQPIVLPKDNGPHDFIIEWWYFNGHLHDKAGNQYSFMDCFFKVNYDKVNIPHIIPHLIEDHFKKGEYIHFANSVISDITNKKSYKEIQDISLVSDDSFKKELLYINYKNSNLVGDHLNSEIKEISQNNFIIKNKHLDLQLISNKKPLLEGGHGYIGTPDNGSYYYSLTDMRAKGKIIIEGKEIEVEGDAWMDHQWADSTYKKDKWTWFSFNLENGTDIMCVEYDMHTAVNILVNMIDKDGNQNQYIKANIKHNERIFKSKKTKAEYPLSWKIEIPEANMEISASALIEDQEMIAGQINYWEGPIKVEAKINGETVNGKGFMELVGYPSDYNYLVLKGKEMEQNFLNKIRNFFRT